MILIFLTGLRNYHIAEKNKLKKLRSQVQKISKRCKNLTEKSFKKRNCFSRLKIFLFDSTFGTCDQMRCQLEIDYTSMPLKIPFKPGKNLDAMIILPKLQTHEEESEVMKMARLSNLDKKFGDQLNKSSFSMERSGMFSMNKTMGFEESCEIDINSLVIFCQPNAAVYEVNCYNRLFLDFYLDNGVAVVLWNYRGYGRSDGKPNMKVRILLFLKNFQKRKLNFF